MEQLLLIAHRFFLNLLEQMMGIGKPRRENCPLDNFLFLLFDSHYIKALIFYFGADGHFTLISCHSKLFLYI
nr:MAG TPA: hypothetical protein [Caudoviricetes sp.]